MILVRHGQSLFNLHFTQTRVDPGIEDPELTDLGRAQALSAARALEGVRLRRVIASPYSRALQTAEVICGHLGLDLSHVEPLVGERAAFACDVGSHPAVLATRFPTVALDHLPPRWWPEMEESEAALAIRCQRFHAAMAEHPERDEVLVVSHWGFIRGLTGLAVTNGTVVRVPRDGAAEVVHIP
ncbi:MAG: histidine phosphatase family protein [Alphaproteobacteria bacterium]|nr:MAG: histidine phosphatase family protein [Alphaproteobacteria bacterium]